MALMVVIERRFIKAPQIMVNLYTRAKARTKDYRLTLIEAVSESTWRSASDY